MKNSYIPKLNTLKFKQLFNIKYNIYLPREFNEQYESHKTLWRHLSVSRLYPRKIQLP